ncbi:hypothetical protein M1L60_17300 [Actinoplanes sp. TRM 88003]|uniref:Uncharacterized protein n=1 Tax=Paractinoplanes aksuensis TaxID=2939490 RepID=A0ABT1DPE6_9ACTN|nr:hypothetical protein [Actinoplanes aksuensis]MCO8272353.1 hypothetical protein [Actinoplanes aksuensis]
MTQTFAPGTKWRVPGRFVGPWLMKAYRLTFATTPQVSGSTVYNVRS